MWKIYNKFAKELHNCNCKGSFSDGIELLWADFDSLNWKWETHWYSIVKWKCKVCWKITITWTSYATFQAKWFEVFEELLNEYKNSSLKINLESIANIYNSRVWTKFADTVWLSIANGVGKYKNKTISNFPFFKTNIAEKLFWGRIDVNVYKYKSEKNDIVVITNPKDNKIQRVYINNYLIVR